MNYLNSYRQNLEDRARLLQLCEEDLEVRAHTIEMCNRSCDFFVNNFCWTFDPRPDRKPNHLPFILYDIQKDYLAWMEEKLQKGEDGLTEKTRDMGATWLFLAWDLWHWRKNESFNALLGSRKEDLVDKTDNPDSLFWKIDYMFARLPAWLRPQGFKFDKHRKSLLLKNPENGNTIVGESANAEFSRQGRYTVIHLDEFAFWPFAGSSWTGAAEATRTRLPVSTVNGMNNQFAELKHNTAIDVFVLDWKDHPLKTQEWYNGLDLRMTPKEKAQEVDRDYRASGGELWLPWYNKLKGEIEVEDPIEFGDTWVIVGSLDYHPRKPASFHFYGTDPEGNKYSLNEFYKAESGMKEVAEWIREQPEFLASKAIFADPQLWAQDQELKTGMIVSRAYIFKEFYGIQLMPGMKGHDLDARELTRDIMLGGKLKISPLCKAQRWEFGEALKWDEYTEQLSQKKGVKEILADKNNHTWDDWKYFILRDIKVRKVNPKLNPPEMSIAAFKQRAKQAKQPVGVGSDCIERT